MRLFFTLLPQRTNWHQKAADPAEFIIDETFGVPGVGTVVAGAIPVLHHKVGLVLRLKDGTHTSR